METTALLLTPFSWNFWGSVLHLFTFVSLALVQYTGHGSYPVFTGEVSWAQTLIDDLEFRLTDQNMPEPWGYQYKVW